jgi:dihydroorotase-like cyclic amidohydrolase
MLLDAVTKGKLTLERAVDSAAMRPAQSFGLGRTKGQLAVGFDADLVVVDMDSPWTITNDAVLSRCGWTPYDGRTCNVRVDRTFVRGNLVYADNRVVGRPGLGAMAIAD